jgi:hypothetical protein
MIHRPVSFEDNKPDLMSMLGRSKFLKVLKEELSEDNYETVIEKFGKGLRKVHQTILDNAILREDGILAMRGAAVDSGFTTTFWPPTPDNVLKAIQQHTKAIPVEWPMHHAAFLSNDGLTSALSVFGPLVPSPHIPGGREITDFKEPPANSTCCFRRCALGSAVQEWKEFIDSGVVRNEPRNLNARFQYAQMRGMEAKKEWYKVMGEIKKMKASRVDETGDNEEGGVSVVVGDEHEDFNLFSDM